MSVMDERVAGLVAIFERLQTFANLLDENEPFTSRYPSHHYFHFWQTEIRLAGLNAKFYNPSMSIEEKTDILSDLAEPNEEAVEGRLIPRLQQFLQEMEVDTSVEPENQPKAEAIKQGLRDVQPVIREFIEARKALKTCLGIGGGGTGAGLPFSP